MRTSRSPQPPTSTGRELAVIIVLLGWMALGFVPLAPGIAYAHPTLVGVGVLTACLDGPVMICATLRWVRRRRSVRFGESGEE